MFMIKEFKKRHFITVNDVAEGEKPQERRITFGVHVAKLIVDNYDLLASAVCDGCKAPYYGAFPTTEFNGGRTLWLIQENDPSGYRVFRYGLKSWIKILSVLAANKPAVEEFLSQYADEDQIVKKEQTVAALPASWN